MGDISKARFKAAGTSLAGCQKFWAATQAVRNIFAAFCDEFGGSTWVTAGDRLVGLVFPEGARDPSPNLWRYVTSGVAFYKPNRRTLSGRNLAKRIDELPRLPSQWEACDYVGVSIGGHGVCVGDRCFTRAQIEGGPDEYVIHVFYSDEVPLACPPDAIEMLASDYEAWRASRRQAESQE